MLTWGFLLLVGSAAVGVILFFSNLDLFTRFGELGFGGYMSAFFDPANLTTQKVFAVVALALLILGIVLYIIGRSKATKSGEPASIVPTKVKKYLRDVKGEFKKIVWPDFKTVVRNTGVVLAMCAVTAVVIVAVDWVCGFLVGLL